ncbi:MULTISPECIES: threonine synthase [unclassified Sphaerochaeta]|jgi:threonine synthase|uniref:threonine synthase n=1 Tax=unclassified Sphaerochaeta TaxID=2637943 RepID=UPI0025DE1EF2|nr:threonine synthase [Sphaerochaeta sp. UBA5856]
MKFVSTRGKAPAVSASQAIMQGLAPDGGLYVPESFPSLENLAIHEISSYPELAFEVLAPFFEDDPLKEDLAEICMDAFNFPVPLVTLKDQDAVLELFHGPTAAFKDFGARFLAACMERMLAKEQRKLTILVATSGDTGGAVAAAFANRKGIEVKVLYPKGRVSGRQQQQLTCWGANIQAYEVDGSFDDCQKMVKDAFMDQTVSRQWGLSSANSINLGRLLPQSVYYVFASHLYTQAFGKRPIFIIPSGNVGNSCAAFWALTMGSPIERIVLSVNENKTIPEFLTSGIYQTRPSVQTLANAMDVGAPSNMERLFNLYPDTDTIKSMLSAYSVDDRTIQATIKEVYGELGYILCPHTATAERVRRDHFAGQPTIVVSTAHPAKFEQVVEPLIGTTVEVPQNLATLLDKPSSFKAIPSDYRLLFS